MASSSNFLDLPGLNFRSDMASNGISNSNVPDNLSYGSIATPLGRIQAPPPLPPRASYNSFNNYTQGYLNNYNLGGYPGYNNYGSFGGYGYGYRPGFSSFSYGYGPTAYHTNNKPESRFIQLAEESTRPAFQSIQTILQACSSVTMMFESTFHAIHSSYMSVLGVADNFGKMRSVFAQMFSTFAVIRFLNCLCRRLLYLLGLSANNPRVEALWMEALNKSSGTNSKQNESNRRSTWSMMLFLSVIVAGPYFLFKLINQIFPSPIPVTWSPTQNPGSLAIGLFDFHSANDQELGFTVHEKLMVAPQNFQPTDCPGWLLACNGNKKIGLIPHNYIGIVMKSEKTGKTYIDHNGQKYETAFSNFEMKNSAKCVHECEGSSEKLRKVGCEHVNETK